MARIVIPGKPHHVYHAGLEGMRLFYNKSDRTQYLKFMREECEKYNVKILAYCLMNNHVHLIAVPSKAASLAAAIGRAHHRYTHIINERQNMAGFLFHGRFLSCPLDDPHLATFVRFVERNPVRLKMVKNAWDYEWSSAKFHVGMTKEDPVIESKSLGGAERTWRSQLKQEVKEPEANTIRLRTRTGRPYGSEAYLRKLEKKTRRTLVLQKRGRKPKKAGKSKKK